MGSAKIIIFGHLSKFQVVPEDFPIPCEVLLGSEYFEISHALLDFERKFMRIGEKFSAFKGRKPLEHTREEAEQNNTGTSKTEGDDTSAQEI